MLGEVGKVYVLWLNQLHCRMLRQLHTKQFCMQLMKAHVAETLACNQLIDSATSLLTIYSPIVNNVVMSLYDSVSIVFQ